MENVYKALSTAPVIGQDPVNGNLYYVVDDHVWVSGSADQTLTDLGSVSRFKKKIKSGRFPKRIQFTFPD